MSGGFNYRQNVVQLLGVWDFWGKILPEKNVYYEFIYQVCTSVWTCFADPSKMLL